MELAKYYGKTVNIVTNLNKNFTGIVGDYIYGDENESGNDSIVVINGKNAVELEKDEIKKIEVAQ